MAIMPEPSPFDPDLAQGGMVNGVAKPAAGGQLADEWRSFAAAPEGRAALIQAGIAMLQPRSPGQTALGQVANAVGQGGEAANNVISQREKEADSQSLRDYRKTTGEAAAAKGDAALLNANTRDLLGARGVTPTSVLQASMQAQRDAHRAIETLLPKGGGPDLDPTGSQSGLFQSIKTVDPRIQTKIDAQRLFYSDKDFQKKVIQLFQSDILQRSANGPALPLTPGARAAMGPRPSAMSDAEGMASGLYDDKDISDARIAYHRNNANLPIIIQRYKDKTGKTLTERDLQS